AYTLSVQHTLNSVNVHGIAGQSAPQITETGNAYLSVNTAEVRHVGILQTSGPGVIALSIGNGGTVEDAVLRCSTACSSVLDLGLAAGAKDVVVTGPTSGIGVDVTGTNIVLRNLTVLVGGNSSLGIRAYTNNSDTSV